MFLLLNKIDERRESEDLSLNSVLSILKQSFKSIDLSRCLFKTSGLNALQFRIMNEGSEANKHRFMRKFRQDYGAKFQLQTEG
jgi:hypothetical protein